MKDLSKLHYIEDLEVTEIWSTTSPSSCSVFKPSLPSLTIFPYQFTSTYNQTPQKLVRILASQMSRGRTLVFKKQQIKY